MNRDVILAVVNALTFVVEAFAAAKAPPPARHVICRACEGVRREAPSLIPSDTKDEKSSD